NTIFSRDWSSDVCSSDLIGDTETQRGFVAQFPGLVNAECALHVTGTVPINEPHAQPVKTQPAAPQFDCTPAQIMERGCLPQFHIDLVQRAQLPLKLA